MKTELDNATLKVWFKATCRIIYRVIEIEHSGNLMAIKTSDGYTFLVNFNNVNMIEEV